MTLGKIKKRLENNEYKTINECIQDFDLMFRKILQPELSDQLIYFQAQELKEIFEQKVKITSDIKIIIFLFDVMKFNFVIIIFQIEKLPRI